MTGGGESRDGGWNPLAHKGFRLAGLFVILVIVTIVCLSGTLLALVVGLMKITQG